MIKQDITKQKIAIFYKDSHLVATGTLEENHITRVFVAFEFQKRGYGKSIMQYLEKEIAKKYDKAYLDASLPAIQFYEKLGYRTIRHKIWPCENHKVLVYPIMEKELFKE